MPAKAIDKKAAPKKKGTAKKAVTKKSTKKKISSDPTFKKKKINKDGEEKDLLMEEENEDLELENDLEEENDEEIESDKESEEVSDEELEEYFDEEDDFPEDEEEELELEEEPKKKTKKKESKEEDDEPEEEENDDEFSMDLDENMDTKSKTSKQKKLKKPNIEEGLTEIYENEDGTMPDMKNFEKKSHSKLLRALVVLILSLAILGGVAYAGFVIFQPQSQFAEEDVIVSISGEEELTIGQTVKYRIRYRNAQSLPLAQSKLQVRFPEGFVMDSAEPAPTTGEDIWDLGTLDKEESGYIDIEGRMYGNLDSEQSFRVFFNYMPSNFSSEFQKVVTQKIKLTQSPFELSLDAPDELAPGVNNDFVVKVSRADLENVEAKYLAIVVEGDNFAKTSSEPENDEREDRQWTLPDFEDETEIKITGNFSPAADVKTGKFVAKLVGWKDDKREGDGYVFATAEHEVIFSHTALNLSLVINGSRGNLNVGPRDNLNGTIVLKNSGEEPIKNARIKLTIDAPSYNGKSILNWAQRDLSPDGDIFGEQLSDEVRRGVITWTKGHIADLTSLESGEEVMIDFQLPIKNSEDTDLTKFTSYNIKVTSEVLYDGAEEQEILSGNTIEMKINSDLTLEIKDEADMNDAGKDFHTVTWLLNNSFHDLKDLKLSAEVYGDVSLAEEDFVVPAGNIDYDDETQKIIWTIDQMPTSVDVLALQFDIVINKKNPSQENLTSKVELSATDTVTGENIIKVGREILLNEEEE